MSGREHVLGSVRRQLGRTAGSPVPPPPPVALLGTPLDQASRRKTFCERLRAVGGTVHEAADAAAAAAVVRTVLAAHGARSLACSRAPVVRAVAGCLRALDPDLAVHDEADRDTLATVDAGCTGATLAVAETGTLVLAEDLERARLPSLLPPLHIALLDPANILSHLGEALARLPSPLPRAVTFVTGPSRTADIELELVVGVHGPKDLHVVLVG